MQNKRKKNRINRKDLPLIKQDKNDIYRILLTIYKIIAREQSL